MEEEPISKEIEAQVNKMIKKLKNQPTKRSVKVKEAHLNALDDIVSINSLFMFAVFVGISMAARGQQSLETREECQAGVEYKKMLLLYEVIAFACFVLSSLVAKVIKLHLIINGEKKYYPFVLDGFDLKDFMLILVAASSVVGIVLVTLSVVYVVQIRIGLFSCGTVVVKCAVVCLGMIVGVGLVIYVVSIVVAIFASIQSDAHIVTQVVSRGDRHKSKIVRDLTQ